MLNNNSIRRSSFDDLNDAQKRQCEIQISKDLIARSMPGAIVVLLLWFCIVFLISRETSDTQTIRWLLNFSFFFILFFGLRLYLAYVAKRNINNTRICRFNITLGLLLGCLTWGVMAACSYLETPLFIHQDLILFATVGLSAGGAVAFSVMRFYTYLYILCMMLPILVVELLCVEEMIVDKVVIVVVYIFGLLGVTVNSSREYMVARVSNLQLIEMSNTDSLTGVRNRRYFDLQLTEELQRARRTEGSIALLIIDIDHFKRVNDVHGHLVGDECLVAVAKCLTKSVQRISDTVARYGGEEFTIILANTGEAAGILIAESIRQSVERINIVDGNNNVPLTISIGISQSNASDEECDAMGLLAAADSALYQAKESGRNRVISHRVFGAEASSNT